MFNNDLIVAVQLSDGSTLRESEGRTLQPLASGMPEKEATVFLPFGTEYRLYIKNNKPQRAVLSIKIDGTNAFGGQQLVVQPYMHMHLERFMLDGNLERGKRFKFVSADDERVQNPEAPELGVIEISCQWETQTPYTLTWGTTWAGSASSATGVPNAIPWLGDSDNQMYKPANFRMAKLSSPINPPLVTNFVSFSSTPNQFGVSGHSSQRGATVEGRDSQQSFGHTYVSDSLTSPTTIRFRLLAPDVGRATTVRATRSKYCTQCGQQLARRAKFCSECGVRQVIDG